MSGARSLASLGLLAAVGFAASCVPASEPAEPAGALGFVTEPSAASLGQPFETSDGWTVRVEMLALQIEVSGSTSGDGFGYSGDSMQYLLRSSDRAELFARGLLVGTASARATLYGRYISDVFEEEDSIENLGLPPEVVRRFLTAPEVARPSRYPTFNGPSLLLVARGEKAGRVVTLDFTLDASDYRSRDQALTIGQVVADSLTTARLLVAAEVMFVESKSGRSVFDDLVAADADADRIVTGAELNAAGFVEELNARARGMLRVP